MTVKFMRYYSRIFLHLAHASALRAKGAADNPLPKIGILFA